MSNLPTQQRALILGSKYGNFDLGDTTVPKPGPGQLLVRIKATALNPVDWKIQKYGLFIEEYPTTLGLDYSGEVVELGPGDTDFKVGDRVFAMGGVSNGNDKTTFQQYTLAEQVHISKIPSNITYEQAATLPLAVTTAYLGMYHINPYGMGLVSPLEVSGSGHYKNKPFVVLGGASSVGQTALQFARLSGFNPIITTASPKHTNALKSFGATHVLDRNLSTSELQSEVRKITGQPAEHVFDAISLPETQNMAIDLVVPGGSLTVVLDPVVSATDKKIIPVASSRLLDYNFAPLVTLYSHLTALVENGSIQPNEVEILPGGLNSIPAGLKRLEDDGVSRLKLIIHPEETSA